MSERRPDLLPEIDAVRGYAILLVITCHVTYAYPELPWPIHRLTVLGWHGVQLFFLASAVTLLMSWHGEAARRGAVSLPAFFLRRYFRIAPAYYAAALLYFWLTPPLHGFDPLQALATITFTNAWTPRLMAVAPDDWVVVRGGWSIGVEFTFYLLFPLFAALATTLARATAILAASIALAALANHAALPWLAAYTPEQAANFLYFWFPNQLPVFATGAVVFHLIRRAHAQPAHSQPAWTIPLRRHPHIAPSLALAAFFAIAYLDLPLTIGATPRFIPAFLLACVPLGLFVLALSAGGSRLFINPPVRAMGQVSFSAYLLHYAIITALPEAHPTLFGATLTGPPAIATFILGNLAVFLATYAAAWCAWWAIERPGMALGKRLAAAVRK